MDRAEQVDVTGPFAEQAQQVDKKIIAITAPRSTQANLTRCDRLSRRASHSRAPQATTP